MIQKFIKEHKLEDNKNVRIGFLSDNPDVGKIDRLPTGNVSLDILTGGGWVKGHINQVVGGESTGKTTIFLENMAYWQKLDQDILAAYLPAEKSFDKQYAASKGISENDALIGEVETAEQNLDFCLEALDPESVVDVLIIDTIQALSPKTELYDKTKIRSTEANSMAGLPRLFSQYLRMHTSRTIGRTTMILASQVRMDLGGYIASLKETGGNAIAHYNVLTLFMNRLSDTGAKKVWPYTTTTLPPNSFVTNVKIKKSKVFGRHKGNEIPMYFYNGTFEKKFNVLALGKQFDVHNTKSFIYTDKDGEHELKARGFNDMYDKITDEQVDIMYNMIMEAFNNYSNGIETENLTINEEEEVL